MIACDECGMENYPGALFCRECAAPLHPATQTIRRPVSRLPLPASSPPTTPQPFPLAKALLQPGGAPRRLRLLIPSANDQEVELVVSGVIWVGRDDARAIKPPDLDLTPYQGYEQGVSRRHATIELCEPGVVMTDRGSSNGTWLNGHRLLAQEPYLLPEKAQVRFGNLLVYLMISEERWAV